MLPSRQPSNQDTKKLWARYKLLGDADAREGLVLAYAPFARRVVDRMSIGAMPHLDRDDLRNHAILGLIDAIDKCDLERCERFEAYASVRVRGAVIDGIREMDWVPRRTRRAFAEMEAARTRLNASLGRAASDLELAQAMGTNEDEVQAVMAEVSHGRISSLDEPMADSDGQGLSLVDLLADPASPDPETRVDALARKDVLHGAIQTLGPFERLVIALYYYENMTLKEIGRVIDRTEARVSQIHKAALDHLRTYLRRDTELLAAA